MSVLVGLWKKQIEEIKGRLARVYRLKNGLEDDWAHEPRSDERMRLERTIERHEQTIRECKEEIAQLEQQIRDAGGALQQGAYSFDLNDNQIIIMAEHWAKALVYIRAEYPDVFNEIIDNLKHFNDYCRKQGEFTLVIPNLARQVIVFTLKKYSYSLRQIFAKRDHYSYEVEYLAGREDWDFIRNCGKILEEAVAEYFGRMNY